MARAGSAFQKCRAVVGRASDYFWHGFSDASSLGIQWSQDDVDGNPDCDHGGHLSLDQISLWCCCRGPGFDCEPDATTIDAWVIGYNSIQEKTSMAARGTDDWSAIDSDQTGSAGKKYVAYSARFRHSMRLDFWGNQWSHGRWHHRTGVSFFNLAMVPIHRWHQPVRISHLARFER